MAKEIVGSMSHRNSFDAKKEQYITIIDDGKEPTSEIIAELRKHMPVRGVYNEDKIDKEFPVPKNPTSRRFLFMQEADEDLANKSANDLEREGIPGITLRERLLYELEYYRKTGQHLDARNITLCAGSRYSDGYVPGVCFSLGRAVRLLVLSLLSLRLPPSPSSS